MPRPKKTWADKMNARPPHVAILDKDFAGVPAGSRLLISSPEEIATAIRSIPEGKSISIVELRQRLAAQHDVDATCPVSTAIFLRTVTEHAFEQSETGTPLSAITPVWRVIEPGSNILKKVSFDPAWILQRRALEGLSAS